MPTVEALRVDHALPVRQLQQHHIQVDESPPIRKRRHMDDDVGVPRRLQEELHLSSHHTWPTNNGADGTLIENDKQQRSIRRKHALLPSEPSPHQLLDLLLFARRIARLEHCSHVLPTLQRAVHHATLVHPNPYGYSLVLHKLLEPIRVLDVRVPVHPFPQAHQQASHAQLFVGPLHHVAVHRPLPTLVASDQRSIAVQSLSQLLLLEPALLSCEPQRFAEQRRRTAGRTVLKSPV